MALEPYANDLEYLQDELAWVKIRARRLGLERRLGLDGQEDEEARAPATKHEETEELLRRRRRLRGQEDVLRQRIDLRRQMSRLAGREFAIDRLCALHGLGEFERTVLLLALAPCFSRAFVDLYQPLDASDCSVGLTPEVAFTFAGLAFAERITRRASFLRHAPLVSAELVTVDLAQRAVAPEDLLHMSIVLGSRTFAYLVGQDSLADELVEFSSVEEPVADLARVVLPEGDKGRILALVENHERYLQFRRGWGLDEVVEYGRGAWMLFHGQPGTGKTMTAHGVAKRLGKRILTVDVPAMVGHAGGGGRFLPGLFREARLQNAILFFDECDLLFESRKRGNQLVAQLLTEMERFDGVAILATNLPGVLDEAVARRVLVKVRFPDPDREARREIWRKHLPKRLPLAADVDLEVLADRYELSGGLIKNAVLTAVAGAVRGEGAATSGAGTEGRGAAGEGKHGEVGAFPGGSASAPGALAKVPARWTVP